eukprot:scaffold13786_cov58-Phaeocystis_antarctica.AAC.2
MPEHVHQPYTRDDDAFLWANRERPAEEVAGELGRGAKSCAARLEKLRSPTTEGHRQHGQSAPPRLPRLLRARLAALTGSALPRRGRPTGRSATASSARDSRLRSRRFHCLLMIRHRRLFGDDDSEEEGKAAALRPAHECIQRIIHDPGLTAADFVVGYRDRFEPGLLRAPFEAPNQ